MAILPMSDELVEAGYYTKEQMRWIAFVQYSMIALCLATLAWLMYNAWKILVKQKKCKVLPLANFYALAFALILFRILY